MGVGAYSRWALIGGWALIRINTVYRLFRYVMHHQNKRGLVFDSS